MRTTDTRLCISFGRRCVLTTNAHTNRRNNNNNVHGSSHLNGKNIYYSIYLTEWRSMCACVRFSSRYIFLFYCYLFHARRLSTRREREKKKYKINKYCIMCLYMQTTEKGEEERIDVCLVRRHVKTLSHRLIDSQPTCPNNVNAPSTRMDEHKHTYVTYQMPTWFNKPGSKLWMRQRERERARKKWTVPHFASLFHRYSFSHFVDAKRPNQTVRSQWVKFTYRRWDEQKYFIECVSGK